MSSQTNGNKPNTTKTPPSYFGATCAVKSSSDSRYLDVPTEEYEQIESCETRGLKLTFRRRSTERSHLQTTERSHLQTTERSHAQTTQGNFSKVQTDIPKLIVQKCRCLHGYSLQNSKRGGKCGCLAGTAEKSEHSSPPVGSEVKDRKKREAGKEKRHEEFGRPTLKRAPKLLKRSVSETTASKVGSRDFEIHVPLTPTTPAPSPNKNDLELTVNRHVKLSNQINVDRDSHNTAAVFEEKILTSFFLPVEKNSPKSPEFNSKNHEDENALSLSAFGLKITGHDTVDAKLNPFEETNAFRGKTEPFCENLTDEQRLQFTWHTEKHFIEDNKPICEDFDTSLRTTAEEKECKNNQSFSFSSTEAASKSDSDISSSDINVEGHNAESHFPSNNGSQMWSCDGKNSTFDETADLKISKVLQTSVGNISSAVVSSCHKSSKASCGEHFGLKFKRSDSAPPRDKMSVSLTPLQPLTFLSPSVSHSKLDQNQILPFNQIYANRSGLEPERSKSSPPICSAGHDSLESSAIKSPVVILDRLPSPVIELYSSRSFSGIDSNSFSSSDLYSDSNFNSNESTSVVNEDHNSDCGDSSEGSTFSDFDNHNETSGKLKFTYRKVAQRKKCNIKSRRKSSHKRKQIDGGELYSEILNSISIEDSMSHTGRKRYSRASKRAIRYVDDDDEYEDEPNASARAGITFVPTSIVEGSEVTDGRCKTNETWRGYLTSSFDHTFKSKPRKSSKKVIQSNDTHEPDDNLVDPRIRRMSTALLHACHTNTNAEKIAFKKKTSIHGFRSLLSKKKSINKSSPSAAKIRRKFSLNQYWVRNKFALSVGEELAFNSESQGNLHDVRYHFEKRGDSEVALQSTKLSSIETDQKQRNRETRVPLQTSSDRVCDRQRLHHQYRNLFESDVFRSSFSPERKTPSSVSVDDEKSQTNHESSPFPNRKNSGRPCREVIRGRGSVESCAESVSGDISERSQASSCCAKCSCLCLRIGKNRGNTKVGTNDENKSSMQYSRHPVYSDVGGQSTVKLIKSVMKANDEIGLTFPKGDKTLKTSDAALTLVESALDLSGKPPLHSPSYPVVPIKKETLPVFREDADSASLQETLIKLEHVSGCTRDTTANEAKLTASGGHREIVHVAKDTDLMPLDYLKSEVQQESTLTDDTMGQGSGSDKPQVKQGRIGHIVWNLLASDMKQMPSNGKCLSKSTLETSELKRDGASNKSTSSGAKPEVLVPNKEFMPHIAANSVIRYSSSSGSAAPLIMHPQPPPHVEQTTPPKGYPTATCPTSNIPPLILNKPLFIQICQSPENSDYGSPPSLTEYSSATWLNPQSSGQRHSLTRDLNIGNNSNNNNNNNNNNTHSEGVKSEDSPARALTSEDVLLQVKGRALTEPLRISTAECQLPNQNFLQIPRMIVTSPSNTPPPSVASSSCSFVSTPASSGHLQKNASRSSSPFRLPSNPISPYKSPSRYTNDGEHKCLMENPSPRGCEINQDKSPHNWVSPNGLRCMHKTQARRVRAPLPAAHNGQDDGDSGDSDSTLLYPTAVKREYCCKSTIHSRRSSLGMSSNGISEGSSNSALNSPNFRHEDKLHAMVLSPSSRSLEKRQSDLSTMVSDLRETISKTKAMKRSRRTNSFSGDSQPKFAQQDTGVKLLTSRPSFERFMSVEPMLDSDTPYATVTKGMDGQDDARRDDFEMMRFVSGLPLRSNLCPLTGSVSSASLAETQIYGLDCTLKPDISGLSKIHKDDALKIQIKTEEEHITSDGAQIPATSSDSLNAQTGASEHEPRLNLTEPRTNDSDSDERPLVVIENAESDEVIDGDEAYKKVVSGKYRLPTGPVVKAGRRGAKRPRKDRGLRISVRSLLSRKSPGKGGHCFGQCKVSRDRFHSRKLRSVKTCGKCTCNYSTVKSKRGARNSGRRGKGRVGEDNRCLCFGADDVSVQTESVDVTGSSYTPKRRRRQADNPVSAIGKPDSPDLLAEQINQSSAARILQELPRYNWLEQKILQRNSYNQSPGAVNLSPSHLQEGSRSGSSTSSSGGLSAGKSPKSSPERRLEATEARTRGKDRDGSEQKRSVEKQHTVKDHKGQNSSSQVNTELITLTRCETPDMTTVELPNAIAEGQGETSKKDLTSLSQDQDYDKSPLSPDDVYDESGLTIDLSQVEDSECPASDVISPVLRSGSDGTMLQQSNFALDGRPSPTQQDDAERTLAENFTVTPTKQTGSVLSTHPVYGPTSAQHITNSLHSANAQPCRDDGHFRRSPASDEAVNLDQTLAVSMTTHSGTSDRTAESSVKPEKCLELTPVVIRSPVTSPPMRSSSPGTSSLKNSVVTSGSQDSVFSGKCSECSSSLHSKSSGYGNSVHVIKCAGCNTGIGSDTNTTTTVTSAPTWVATTTKSTTASPLTAAVPHGDTLPVPLDLCLKKSDSLSSSNLRVKGNPPVQMVLPQVQHKVSVAPSPLMGITSTSPAADLKVTGKTNVTSVQNVLGIDSMQTWLSDDGILSAKAQQLTEFKVETSCPRHSDSLDLCIKSAGVIRSLAADVSIDKPAHPCHLRGSSTADGPVIDERITIGLALSAELETETDRDRTSKLLSRDVSPSIGTSSKSIDNISPGVKPDVMDVPTALPPSYQEASKTMTDAELDQEFQKHLIEFKALEKLAERKAQEQMQVALMRKRKAEMLRIMELKKAKRDFDRVGQTGGLSQDADNKSSAISTSQCKTVLTSSQAPQHTNLCVSKQCLVSTSGSTLQTSSLAGSVTMTTLDQRQGVLNLAATDSVSKASLTSKSSEGEKANSGSMQTELVTDKHSPLTAELFTASIKCEMLDSFSPSKSMAPVHCKDEMMENDASNIQNSVEGSESVCKETKFIDESVPHKRESNSVETDTETLCPGSDHKNKTKNEVEPKSEKNECTINGLPFPATPVPAHQTQPQPLPMEMTQESSSNMFYCQGPYRRRETAILEPPFLGKEHPKDEQPQRAHSQRPFQTAGNLIVPIGGPFSLSGPNCSHSSSKHSPGNFSVTKHSNTTSKSQQGYRSIAPRPIGTPVYKTATRPSSNSDGVTSHSHVSDKSEALFLRTQRKSLDESDLREHNRTVQHSGPKSAEQVKKAYQSFQQVNSDKKTFTRLGESIGLPPPLHQQQELMLKPMVPTHPAQLVGALRSNERPGLLLEDVDKKSAFKVHVRPQNNLVIDLTRDGRPSSVDKLTMSAPIHGHSQQTMASQPTLVEDSIQCSKQESLSRKGQLFQNTGNQRTNIPSEETPGSLFTDYQQSQDKCSLPNGFNSDRSRPGGFLTNRHRLPPREPARPVAVKDVGFFRDHVRPSVSSVTQHRQRYMNPASVSEGHMTIPSQPNLSTGYHKSSDDLSPLYTTGAHPVVLANTWVDDHQHPGGIEFPPSHGAGQWRGHSPQSSSRATHLIGSQSMDMYADVEIGNRLLTEDLEKQRSRPEIHPAFHKPNDLVYKQQKQIQVESGLCYGQPGMGVGSSHPHSMTHSTLHPGAAPHHQQWGFQPRGALTGPGSLNESYLHQQTQQQHQQQQKKMRPQQQLDLTPSWRTYGTVDGSSLNSSALQPRSTYLQSQAMSQNMNSMPEALAYQKLQQQQQQAQQQQQHLIQQQQYQFLQLQQGRPSQKVLAPPQGSSPTNQRMVVAPPPHANQNLALPQLMYGECSSSPNYTNISPTSSQSTGLIMSQSQAMHHRSSDPDHLAMLHQQRQQSKHGLYDQRTHQPAAQTSSQMLVGMQPNSVSMAPLPGPPARPVPGYGPMGPGASHPGSVTNSLCRVCGKVAVYLCSSCRRVWYCNQQCQTKHWGVHAAECKPLT